VTPAQEQMALAAVAMGIGLQQPMHPGRGTALDSRVQSRDRAALVFALSFFAEAEAGPVSLSLFAFFMVKPNHEGVPICRKRCPRK
jgi:hypothetical protein